MAHRLTRFAARTSLDVRHSNSETGWIDATTRAEARDHVVHFYRHDDELAASVAEFLLGALRSDGAAVAVTTLAHLVALEAALIHGGVDIVAARAEGRLVTVDADEALSRFLVDDWPDFGSFVTEVGDMIRTVTETARPVKVFGEMVALLWDAGHVAAAIELEKLWNEFGDDVPFSLMCAYPAQSVTGDGTDDAFLQICQCHSAVFGADEDRWDPTNRYVVHRDEQTRLFTGETTELGAARAFVADTLNSWGLHQLVDDGAIVVSELATNAIIHAESDFAVSLSSHGDAVRVSVHDHSPAIPAMRSPLPDAVSGRGLRLIAALTRRWGTDLVSDGKVVWAELIG